MRDMKAALTVTFSLLAASAWSHAGAAQSSKPNFPADSAMHRIQERGKLVVGIKIDAPLFGLKNPMTGKVEGFDADIANLIAKRIFGENGHVDFVEAPTPTREALIKAGKVDMVIATYTINKARSEQVNFAGPYFESRNTIMVKNDDKSFGDTINGFKSLNGHSVCTTQNGTQYNMIQAEAPKADLKGFDTMGACLTAMRQGRVEAAAAENAILFGMAHAQPGQYRVLANSDAPPQPYGIGVKKEDPKFCEWINEQLRSMFKDGEWANAYKSTLGAIDKVVPQAPEASAMHYCSS
ncbi:MAG: glutamate ABC transporter substrate-binding protein [Variibacter sp.]